MQADVYGDVRFRAATAGSGSYGVPGRGDRGVDGSATQMTACIGKSCPEIDLLLCCARNSIESAGADRLGVLLHERINWSALLRMAFSHRMMPLLYWRLYTTCPKAVPAESMACLQAHFEENARHNLHLTRELCAILELFERNGIKAIPWKGPVLAGFLYGNLALRQFCDLDFLVAKKDVARAKELLAARGYRPHLELNGAWESAYLESGYDYLCARDDGGIVELHWAVAEKYFYFPLDYQRLWERLESVALGGKEVRTLSAEDLLLILCVHGARHLWRGLGWICDVAALISPPRRIDWARVTYEARALGCERMVLLGLLLASELLGATLPPDVLTKVRGDHSVNQLAMLVQQHLFTDTDPAPGLLKAHRFRLSARERLSDRIRYCMLLAFVPNEEDWAILPLPPFLVFLYSVVRPIRLLVRYGLAPLKHFL